MESRGSKTDTHPKFFLKNAFFLLSDQNQQAIRFTNGGLKNILTKIEHFKYHDSIHLQT